MWSPGDILVSGTIIFFSVGLFSYWIARAHLLLSATPEEVDQVLEYDLWWGRRVLISVRAVFAPPATLLLP